MTEDIKQIQEENRKLILEAIHGCNYEEAINKELSRGCKIEYSWIPRGVCGQTIPESHIGIVEIIEADGSIYLENGSILKKGHYDIYIHQRPNFFSRVLLSLKNVGKPLNTSAIWLLEYWDLEIETLEQQTPEVQIAINQLLTK